MTEPVCNPCEEDLPDYTIGTWRCYLTPAGGSEIEFGNVIISAVNSADEVFPSYAPDSTDDTRYMVSFRNKAIVRVAIDEVNPRTLHIFFNTVATAISGGYRLDLTTVARKTVYKVRMVHEMACRVTAQLELILHRASIAQPVEMPWSAEANPSAEVEFHAMYCPGETQPFGYINVTGDFNVQTV
jgi:hypothetical protein